MKKTGIALILIFWKLFVWAQIQPALPNTSEIETCFPDTTGYAVWTVGPVNRDYSDLQAAINAAEPGTILLLDAGISFPGSFVLPPKTGDKWVILMSSQTNLLPKQGERVAPFLSTGLPAYPIQLAAMPRIISMNPSGLPAFRTQARAHHYRLVGLEITVDTSVLNSYGLVLLGDGGASQNTLEVVPHDLIIDRCYIHGHSKATIMKSGVLLNAANSAVINSYIADFHSIGFDTYAIGGTNGPGPFIIRNNYLEAAGENILFGGAAPNIPGLVPSDIEVRNNHFFKPFSWRVGHPTYAGLHWTIKNLFELKTGKRVLLEGNLLENCWADLPTGQSGYAILLTVRAEGGASPMADVSDITIANNIIRHAGAGISLSGHDSPTPSLQSKRIRIANNLFDDINGPVYGDGNVGGPNDGTFLKIGDPAEVSLEHNTVLQSGAITWAYDTTHQIAFRNNLFHCFVSDGGYQGIYGPGFAQGGNGPMARFFPDISDANQQFHKNVLISGPDFRYSNYNTLSQNYFPANPGAVGFVDYPNGSSDFEGYRLAGTSPYKNAGTDGRDLGVDFEELTAVQNAQFNCGPLVAVSELKNGGNFQLWPNPFAGQVILISDWDLKNAVFIARDMLGREIVRVEGMSGKQTVLDLSRVGAGVCFYQILQEGESWAAGMLIKN